MVMPSIRINCPNTVGLWHLWEHYDLLQRKFFSSSVKQSFVLDIKWWCIYLDLFINLISPIFDYKKKIFWLVFDSKVKSQNYLPGWLVTWTDFWLDLPWINGSNPKSFLIFWTSIQICNAYTYSGYYFLFLHFKSLSYTMMKLTSL